MSEKCEMTSDGTDETGFSFNASRHPILELSLTGERRRVLNDVDVISLVDLTDDSVQPDEYSTTDSEAFTINDLPVEILHIIMSHMTQVELCQSVASVCKLWKELADDPMHWQRLEFCKSDVRSGTLLKCLGVEYRAKRLKHLTWNHTLRLGEAEFLGENCKQLLDLNLGFCENLDAQLLTPIVHGCPLIETLNLEGCSLVDEKAINLLCTLPMLCDVNLSHCTRLDDNCVVQLARCVPVLIRLNIDGIAHITNRAIAALVEHQRDSLCTLELDGAELTDRSVELIATCPLLSKLTVSFAELLTGRSLKHIGSMSGLQELMLKKGNEFRSEELLHLFQKGQLSNLCSLDLSECTQVDDDVVKALVKCCGSKLQRLNLCWCWNVSDDGLQEIVFNCRKMRHLDLLGIDKMQGDVLVEVPYRMPELTFLNLQQCNQIQDDIVECMVGQKPDLVAVNYYGEEFCAGSDEMDL